MFDATGAFAKQFEPVSDGYLYYPSRKEGGKLVSREEFEQLTADWKRVAGTGGIWKTVAAVFVALIIWTTLEEIFSLPKWSDTLAIAAVVVAVSAWLFWASLAPRRLVKDRPSVAPPRSTADARRASRSALNWPFVGFALLLSGSSFFAILSATDRSPKAWAWLIGSGAMFAAYVWIALKKLTDRRG